MSNPISRLGAAVRLGGLAVVLGLAAPILGAWAQQQQAATDAPATPASAAPTQPMSGMKGMEGMEGMEGMAGMDHDHDHMMTPEQMAELRSKVTLYAVLSDEEIMANMGRMPPNFWGLISSPDIQGSVGVLMLGHGYKLGGNQQFENYAEPISKVHPTAVAPGMAMMSSSHIQAAVDELTKKHGVKTIVVMPMELGKDTTLVQQWQYIFGLRDDSAWLSVPRVKTDAKIIFTDSPVTDPRIGMIMRDYAVAASTDPARDRLILVSHGPEKPEDNPAELAIMAKHAATIRANSAFRDVHEVSIQDDAVPEVRAGHIAELRALIKEATDQGRRVIVEPMLLTKGGFHARLQKDLAGLDYTMVNRGLIEHPEFQAWISDTVRRATAG